jgi:TatD DNase family protein
MFCNIHSHHQSKGLIQITQYDFKGDNPLYFSAGIPPWKVNEYILIPDFIDVINKPGCLAVGEIGLDKIKDINLDKQIEIFIRQIELSEEFQLPVIIHCVKAWNELKQLKRAIKPTQNWIYHGFSKKNILNEVLEEGMLVSFGQRIMNDLDLLKSSLDVSKNKIFFETDDKQVEIEQIYSAFANAKQITLQELKEIQYENFKRVFKKWKSG